MGRCENRKLVSRPWCWVGGSPGLQAGSGRPRQSPALPVLLQLGGERWDWPIGLLVIGYSPREREEPAPETVPGIRRGDAALATGSPNSAFTIDRLSPKALYKFACLSVCSVVLLARPIYIIAHKFVAKPTYFCRSSE